ncbi:MAG: PQQ-binding-like beta-propeller repeat protein [Planctomycetaceae bacterium]|nr:PQQ-binding-like beta-propeller repeat protein [Planctomycetaceae bacterium]
MTRAQRSLLLIALIFSAASVRADDWPQWRHDAQRTAVGSEKLPETLSLLWTQQWPQLEPAWPDQIPQNYMTFDVSYKPVVLGKRMFVGSSLNHRLTAIDTDTGKELWRFYADGPIRFAPVAWKDFVYVASDDGYLYCLAAADGSVKWQVRGGPDNRKVLGNDHLVGMWPLRGGPALEDGIIYFGASIWPFMGTFLHAVDAQTGKSVWCNSGLGDFKAAFALQGTGMLVRPGFHGSCPQGYLLVADNRLAVPQGRNMAQLFDRTNGDLMFHEIYGMHEAHHPQDYWFALRAGKNVYAGPMGSNGIDIASGRMSGRNGVGYGITSDKAVYIASGGSVSAKDAQTGAGLWNLALPAGAAVRCPGSYIKAGANLYIPGANGQLLIVKDADADTRSAVAGPKLPAGEVWDMLAADGKLFVVTRDGTIACYGAAAGEAKTFSAPKAPAQAQPQGAAADILKTTGQTEGYCLVLGLKDGKLAQGLVLGSKLNVIAIDPDAAKVAAIRKQMDDLGLYGRRFSAHVGNPLAYGLPAYLANLIVSEVMDDSALASETSKKEMMRVLRPYGGTICLSKSDGSLATLVRKGGPEGSAEWTHNNADAANSMMSYDKLVKGPLGVLWFGGPPNTPMLPRHGRGPSPAVAYGRAITLGCDLLRAMDIYTGRLLWEAPFPNIGQFYNTGGKQMGTHETGPNYACSEDSVYVITPDKCVQLDAATGKQTRELPLPEGAEKDSKWATIRVDGAVVVATVRPLDTKRDFTVNSRTGAAAKYLAAYDRASGKPLWVKTAATGFRSSGVAAGTGKVFAIDGLSADEAAKRRGVETPVNSTMYAFDATTGKQLWKVDQDVFGTWLGYSAENGLLIQSGCGGGDPTALAANKASDGSRVWRCPATAADKQPSFTGPPLLHHDIIIPQYGQVIGMKDGKLRTRTEPVSGEEVAWGSAAGGCGFTHGGEYMTFHRAWSSAGYTELSSPPRLIGLGGFRSGCTANMVPAGGIVTAPEYTRECECQFQNKCSMALITDATAEAWSFEMGAPAAPARVARVGLNFGAPGDRVSEDGTLWLDCPDVGGPSAQVKVDLQPAKPNRQPAWAGNWRRQTLSLPGFGGKTIYRHVTAVTDGPLPWVTSSGLDGVTSVKLTLAGAEAETVKYTVRLYFAELEDLKPGQRVFSVSLQGKEVLKDFDIAQAAGGAGRGIVKEFKDIAPGESLNVEFKAAAGKALICGLEAILQK